MSDQKRYSDFDENPNDPMAPQNWTGGTDLPDDEESDLHKAVHPHAVAYFETAFRDFDEPDDGVTMEMRQACACIAVALIEQLVNPNTEGVIFTSDKLRDLIHTCMQFGIKMKVDNERGLLNFGQ